MFSIAIKGEYLKMNLIEQTNCGQLMAVAYQDMGRFKVKVFNQQGQDLANIDVNSILNIDESAIGVDGLFEPCVTCCFKGTSELFVQCYHRLQKTSYHFTFSIEQQELKQPVAKQDLSNVTDKNFAVKSFYSEHFNEFYTFFRQG